MKYSKLTAILEKTIEALESGDDTQCKRAEAITKAAGQQISAWRELRCYYQARDEKPPSGEMDK